MKSQSDEINKREGKGSLYQQQHFYLMATNWDGGITNVMY